jgi:hypothetical protein
MENHPGQSRKRNSDFIIDISFPKARLSFVSTTDLYCLWSALDYRNFFTTISMDCTHTIARLLEIRGYEMSAVSGSWLGVMSFEDESN